MARRIGACPPNENKRSRLFRAFERLTLHATQRLTPSDNRLRMALVSFVACALFAFAFLVLFPLVIATEGNDSDYHSQHKAT